MDNQSDHTSQPVKAPQSNQIPWWVKSICIIVAVGAVSYKFIIGEFDLDFNAFLSLVLALFSIFLSAEFYFKATDTSNKFYDNIYKFTKDIAQLLVKIESSFGQQLKSIDERQLKMNDWVYNGKMSEHEIEKTEDEIDKQKVELERINNEQQKIIDKLIEEAKMKDDEKDKIKHELAENRNQYLQTKHALSSLRAKLLSNDEIDEITHLDSSDVNGLQDRVRRYSQKLIATGMLDAKGSIIQIKDSLNLIRNKISSSYLNDMENLGFMNDGILTNAGARFYRKLMMQIEDERRMLNMLAHNSKKEEKY